MKPGAFTCQRCGGMARCMTPGCDYVHIRICTGCTEKILARLARGLSAEG